jgi:hypothetical protein
MFKVLVVSALVMGFGLVVIGSDTPVPIQPLPEGDGANWDLKEQLTPVHQDPEENVIPDQSTIDQKEAERLALSKAAQYDPALRTAPEAGEAVPYFHPMTELFYEGFEGGIIPPTDWTHFQTNSFTWEIDDYNPFQGVYNTSCFYDSDGEQDYQDEGLFSPPIDLTTDGTDWVLSFAWMMSYYWGVDPYDEYDLEVYIRENDQASFELLWTEADAGAFESWTWYETTIPLTATHLTYTEAQIVLHYWSSTGDGAQGSFDAISINFSAPPVGRCCYGVDMLECADITEAECAALSGNWNEALNCTDHPCTSVPANDDWENAEEIYPPCTVTGSTENATLDCPGVLDWNAVWYVFEAPYAENDVDVDFCGTVPGLTTVGVVLYGDPVVCADYILRTDFEWWDCGDGEDNPHVWWDRLPGPATYYFPVFTGDDKVAQPFSFDITVDESPPLPPGGSCGDPYPLSLGSGDLPYTEAGLTTCGMGDVYNNTCLGYYDGGEDFIMELTLTEPLTGLSIKLDPKGLTYSGISLDDECPDADESCIDYSTNSGSGIHGMMGLDLAAGTYYIMVDTWPSPDCLPEFDIIFEVVEETPGDDCSDPYVVKLPDDMVDGPGNDQFINVNTTCGRIDDYDATCLGSYDGGEDMIYMLDVGANIEVDILFSPGVGWTGISLDDECPDSNEDCLYMSTAYSGDHGLFGVSLSAGYYYIQIDTWPSPDCIPEFTLTIQLAGGGSEGDNWEECVELSGDVVDLPFTTFGYTPDGPQDCMYGPNIWYCYTATESGLAVVSLCGSSYDTKLAVYDGVDPYSATMMGCNDDACGVQSELIDLPMVSGNTYLVEVGGYSSYAGDGILNIDVAQCPPPPNDNCEDVTPELLLHGNTVTFTGDNTCATNQCGYFPGGHTWHAITLPVDMDVTLDYCTNSPAWGNAWLNLAIGCPCSDYTFAASYEFSSCGDGNVTMTWLQLPAGTYYYPVLKDPGNDAVGPYTLHVVGYGLSQLTTAPASIDFGTQPAGSMGSTELTLGADGEGDINFAISYVYSVKSASPGIYDNLSTTAPEKPEYSGPAYEPPTTPRQGGDVLSSATPITTDSYNNTGTTSGYVNDYDEVCPYTGSTAPDVVYSYTATADKVMDVDMLGSAYDTKIYIYENDEYTPVACNDDYYSDYVSALFDVPITSGNTYYIVVDGYGTANGEYVIAVEVGDPPDPFECPPGAIPENEACGDDTNGGCNMASPAFEAVNCGDTICGTAWADGGSRDTDWYELTLYAQVDLTITASANFEFIVGPVDTSDCNLASAIDPYVIGAPNTVQSVTKTVGPGTYWIFMGFLDYYDYPCGTNNDYWITFTCPEGPVLWLSAAPETGTVPGDGTLPITVMYDATELDLGTYSADLRITHDGRTITDVPVTLTIGTVVPPDTLVLVPDPISSMMENDIDGVDPNGYIYIGDDLGWVNPAVTTVGDGGRATIPCTYETIGSYPGLTAPILKLTFDLSDFAAMYNEGLMWDCETRSYVVTGTDDGGPISAGDDFTYCGHTSGDLDLDGEIDISDLVMMIEYMFSGGDAPEILLTADIDGNGEVDISDLVAFVDYMFNNGVPPVHQ